MASDFSRAGYHVNGQTWTLVTKSRLQSESDEADIYRRIHIVRILDHTGEELVNARIWGNWDEAEQAAISWQNGLCRSNRGQFVRFVIEEAKQQF